MSSRSISLRCASSPLGAKCKPCDRGGDATDSRRLALEIERLWTLVALQDTVRARKLEFVPLTNLDPRIETSRTGLDELFGGDRSYLDFSFEDVLALASKNVAEHYRRIGIGSPRQRVHDRLRAILDLNDEASEGSWVRCLVLSAPLPDVSLNLWELPAGKPARPYRHVLEGSHVLVVLEGQAILRSGTRARHLKKDQAAVVGPGGEELLNDGGKRVRFLLFGSTAG